MFDSGNDSGPPKPGSRRRRVQWPVALQCGILWLLAGPAWSADLEAHRFNPYSPDQLPLAPKHREYLAAIEHRGLTLTAKGFPAFAKALLEQDSRALTRVLTSDFTGSLLPLAQARTHETQALSVRRVSLTETPSLTASNVDATVFVNFLIELRRPYGKNPKVKLALMGLRPLHPHSLDNSPWHGTALLEIRGTRNDGAAGEIVATLEFELARIVDVEQITSAEQWIKALRIVDLQEAISPKPLMQEVAKDRGIDPAKFTDTWTLFPPGQRPVVTGGVYVGDINNDSLEDILVTDLKGLFLFQGQPEGRFVEVTKTWGLPTSFARVPNAALADFDNDGFVDLLLDYRAFQNQAGKKFVEVTSRTGFRFPNATGFTVADYDRDGLLDLYVTRYYGMQVPRTSKNSWIDGPGGPGNQLWRNLGDWKFQEVSLEANATAGHRSCFTAAWMDANNDDWPDLYVINEFGGGVLLLNSTRGSFQEQPLIDDVGDFGSMGLTVADYNNDGWIDVFTANMYSKSGQRVMQNLPEGSYEPAVLAKMKRFVTGSELYHNEGKLRFSRKGRPLRVHRVGWSYGAAFLDLDNDGFLDLYGTAGFASVNREEPDG